MTNLSRFLRLEHSLIKTAFVSRHRAERQIVKLQIDNVAKMLKSNQIELSVTDNALDYLAAEGYDPEFGARPVKRAIQRLVLNQLSKDIIAQKVTNQAPITIDATDDGLVFRNN